MKKIKGYLIQLAFSFFVFLFLVLFSIFILGYKASAQTVLIPANAAWKYLDNGSNQDVGWRSLAYSDALWSTGAAELGYGDFPATTVVGYKNCYYFRKAVSLTNISQYSGFTLKIRRDDGIVVYINGVEVYRSNMPAGNIYYNTWASLGCADDGNTVFTVLLPASLFVNGNNVVAAEVHNSSPNSSDLTYELQLIGNIVAAGTCAIPNSNLFGVSNLTSSTANVFWQTITGAQSYSVAYRIRNSGAMYSLPVNTSTTSIILSSLQSSTNYEFIVQTVCAGGTVSAFSTSGWFTTSIYTGPTTSCSIPNVNYFGTRNKTATSVQVFWNSVTGASSYNVEYRIRNSGANYSTPFTTNLTYLDLNSLAPGTNYEFIVQSVCSGGTSVFSTSGWFSTLAGTSTVTLIRGPYLTVSTSSGIQIQWRTSTATNSEVKYGSSPSTLINTITDLNSSIEHSVNVSALSPNTKYYYSIGPVGSVLQSGIDNSFLTAPTNASSTPIKFWVTGDFGNGSSGQLAVRNSFSNYSTGQVINGWMWLGDNAYTNGTDLEYQNNVFNVYNSIFKNTPIFPTPGNHDYGQSGYQSSASLGLNFPYFNIFTITSATSGTEKYYSTNYGNIHFISLDSYGSYNNSSSAMYNWLQSDLLNNTQQWTIVAFHHPPYSKGSHDSDTETELIDMRNNIVPLLESFGVDLVLSGHSHSYERSFFMKGQTGLETNFNPAIYPAGNVIQSGSGPFSKTTRTGPGTVYVVCGVSGQANGATSPGYPHNAMYKSIISGYGSLILNVTGGVLQCSFLNSTGVIEDDFSIQKPAIAPMKYANDNGIDENAEVSIYPNPTEGSIHIKINGTLENNVIVRIINPEGNLFFSKQFSNSSDEILTIEKEEANLKAGLYIISIQGEFLKSSKKLVVY